MRIPTRTEITILTIAIVLLSALGLHARSTAAAPVMLFCPPGQSERTTYSYTGGWPQPIQTCGLDIIPGSVPIGLLVPTAQPEGFTVPGFNQGGTLVQTVPETLGQPEGITLPNYGTGGGVYNANDAVYAQLVAPNNEEATCVNQGGVFSSSMFGSSCAFPAGGTVEQPGSVVDTTGWTADQFGTTVDSVGGTANVVGNVAPGFSDEDAAAQVCVNAGNIYVWGQGCDVVIPMGGVVEGPGSVVDMIGSAVSGTGFQAPQLGDPGIDATYCAMASGGFGACKPGGSMDSPTLGRTIVNGSTITVVNGQVVGVENNVVGNGNVIGNNVVINNGQVVVDGRVVQTFDEANGIRIGSVNGINNVEYRNGVVTIDGVRVDPATVPQWSSGRVINNVSTENHYHADMGDVQITEKIKYRQGNDYVRIDHGNGVCDFYYGCANIVTPNGYALQIVDGVKTGIVKWPEVPAAAEPAAPPAEAAPAEVVAPEAETQVQVTEPSKRSLVDRMRDRKLREAGGD